jgi:zinc-binding in reverse transcriptase
MLYTGYQRAGISSIQEIHLQKKHQVKAQEITGDPTKLIRKVLQADRMETFHERKFQEESYKYIEWSVFKKSIKKKRAKCALLKMFRGVTPTKKHLTKIRLTMHTECPYCRQQDEDIFHILTCNVRAHTAEEVFLQEIKKSYKDLNNKDSVWIHILDSARSTDNKMSNWSIQHQTTIGWDQLLEGFITKEGKEVMENLVPDRNWEDTMATSMMAL